MAILLGLLSAAVYGAADFVGGITSRRTGAAAVVVWSQAVGGLVLLSIVLVQRTAPTVEAVAWGSAAGLGGGLGVLLLYRGLAIGRMGVVAPLTSLLAAGVPLLVGVALGDRPGAAAWAGVVLALVAIVLVSAGGGHHSEPGEHDVTEAALVVAGGATAPVLTQTRRDEPHRRLRGLATPGVVEALGAGVGFGAFFVLLDQAGGEGLWPLVAARSSIPVIAVVALATRQPVRPTAGSWAGVVTAGVLDQGANVLYLLAARRGLLSLVAVLVSLYPASTVLLARIVLRERFERLQVVGLAVAAAGVALIAGG